MSLLDRTRALALALPGAIERLSHGQPGFLIEGGRFFAYFWDDHHGDGRTVVITKTSGADEQGQLIQLDPALYFSPAYLGASGWIAMRVDGDAVDWDRLGDRIAASWALVASKRLRG